MQLFVGLGNPGAKYAHNRHNIGFMVLDGIAADHGFGPWKSKFQGQIAEGRLGGDKVLLLKPETFMNLSGQSVGEAMRFYKLEPGDVTVFHDELDLAPGKVRVKQGGGHAGHNGLRSIHGHIGEAYRRVRLGIGHPGRKELVSGYVLHDFARADEGWLDDVLRGVSDGANHLAAGDGGKFMNAVSLRTAPPRSSTSAKPQAKPDATPKAAPTPKAAATPKSAPAPKTPPASAPATPATESERTPMQKLMDKFR
ncbi:aminoacyl-tRNA hydrolase [Antarcticimicrobium sediminis]|uniref:Peptidyl-tRNA hydrolase n=1 Tax=Antarcticimicrobium sediminis TaxID=2546227 RepID=A0A4R5EHG4_9RHOB|nr:aminoacyl-tRNA hydrolase [Antarcticimicrobium sediminis]TDE33919.1 aminoacyl-tRNA hydrolase [Antarcticimicrobium sediminis]